MRNARSPHVEDRHCGRQLNEALDRLESLVVDGLRHGFFRCTIQCDIGKANKRELVIEAGMSHKYVIPEDELPR